MTKPGDLPTKKTIYELVKEFPDKSYRELEQYKDAEQLELIKEEIHKREREGLEPIQREIRWREKYNKEYKLRQEAEGELSILRGIETNRVKEAQARCDYLQNELDRIKRENNDLHNKVAALLDAVDPLQKARESGL